MQIKLTKRRWWQIGAGIAGAWFLYMGSYFVVVLGQWTCEWEWARRANIDYMLQGPEWGPEGIRHDYDHPWMRIYDPLVRHVYERSSNPDELVRFNSWGKLVNACCEYPHFLDWRKAWQSSEDYRGWSHAESFPERFPSISREESDN